jgi:hypothetical protein
MRATNLSVAHAYCHVLLSVNKVNEMKCHRNGKGHVWRPEWYPFVKLLASGMGIHFLIDV